MLGASALVKTGFEPATRLRACPELGCQATMASTPLEARACGVSWVGMFISSTSLSCMPLASSAVSSSRWETKPSSTPTFIPFSSATVPIPGRATTMSLPLL